MTLHDDELQQERGVNAKYMTQLDRERAITKSIKNQVVGMPANARFVGNQATPARKAAIKAFIGRVVLDTFDPDLGMGFYVGSERLNSEDLQVVSVFAPMAYLFYKGVDTDTDISDSLAGRRIFTRSPSESDLIDFEDEVENGVTGDPFKAVNSPSTAIESAPSPARRPVALPDAPSTPLQTVPAEIVPEAPQLQEALVKRAELRTEPPSTGVVSDVVKGASVAEIQVGRLRAPRTVLSVVTAPRTGRLKSLLATLQPLQYKLVTWPEEDHLIIQGHPGTGKTVIGVHRAVYLLDNERLQKGQKPPKGDILVLGPTPAYVDHVKPLIDDLAPTGCSVWSLQQFYAHLGGHKNPNHPVQSARISTSVDPLASTIERAFADYSGSKTVQVFCKYLFTKSPEMVRAARDNIEVLEFLASGKSFDFASKSPSFQPLLALAGLLTSNVAFADQYRHVIVDESQDLSPIDLRIFAILVSHGVTLTLLGDMNQRRSDFTHDSWQSVAEDLQILDDRGGAPTTVIETGFRSTNQILRYASGLLPKSQRLTAALRDGPEPLVVKASTSELLLKATAVAEQCGVRNQGLTAVIIVNPTLLENYLRSIGWDKDASMSWRRDPESPSLKVLHPDGARGLEFDSVVVVEPADFPSPLGRHGVLYTSLTRATKQLAVVHSKALQRELRPH